MGTLSSHGRTSARQASVGSALHSVSTKAGPDNESAGGTRRLARRMVSTGILVVLAAAVLALAASLPAGAGEGSDDTTAPGGYEEPVRDDEGPGRAVGFQVSSLVQDTDTPEDAFGNANGAVEPESFIFGDGGVSDNGNQILGDEGETVDFISWQLPEGIPLAGYRLTLSGDGTAQQNNRSAELVRFLVDGDEVDLFDNQAFNGSVNRVFAGGTRVGSDFRVELTRTTSGGPRLLEIDALIGPITPLNGEVVLNEIVSSNADSLRDENGDSSDWIEVFNGRDVPVSLAGWGLSDASDRPFRWRFPEVTLAPHTYLVVFASGKDRRVPGNNLHTNFQLKSDGERVVLTQPEGILRDGVELGRLRADVSYGRHPSGLGSWKFLATPTPRRSNTPQTPYDSVVFDAPAFSAARSTRTTCSPRATIST